MYSNYRQWGFLPHIGTFFRVSLISLCLKTFRGVARSKPILGGLIYFYRLEIANKRNGVYHGSLETFGGPQRHAIAHLKAGKMVIPNVSSVMLGKSVLFQNFNICIISGTIFSGGI